MKTKVFYIQNIFTDKIEAISEDKDDIFDFFMQNLYSDDYVIRKETKQKKCDKLLVKYSGRYVYCYDHFSVLAKDETFIVSILQDEIDNLEEINNVLKRLEKMYDGEDRKAIKKTRGLLKPHIYTDGINLIDARKIVSNYYASDILDRYRKSVHGTV